MPPVFKALSTIAAWVLFVFGLLRLVIGLVVAFSLGPAQPPIEAYLDFAVGVSSITLSVVVMELRRRFQ